MKNQLDKIEEKIIDRLEENPVDKLPPVRQLAQELGTSFPVVQNALTALMRKGILDLKPRQGAYVREGWKDRALDHNMAFFRQNMLWLNDLQNLIANELPELRLRKSFRRGMFELQVTLTVQQNSWEYLDLRPYFQDLNYSAETFFNIPFQDFDSQKGLFGIPWTFSPRVMFYNPKILDRAGCPHPKPGWTWQDFLEIVKHLRKTLPGEQVFNWYPAPHHWMNTVIRAGGTLFDPSDSDPVKIDSPATRHGLQLYRELQELLGIDAKAALTAGYTLRFRRGEQAFNLNAYSLIHWLRHDGFQDWEVIPLPSIPGGKDLTMQATELLCVRRDCVDDDLIRRFLTTMLSEKVQDYIGHIGYGIPIRRSSAFTSLNIENPRDAVFLSEISKITAKYHLDSSDLGRLISSGIQQIWQPDANIDEITGELSEAVRLYRKFRG